MDAPSIIRTGCAVLALACFALIFFRRKKEKGPDAFEYALMVGFILVSAVAVTRYGPMAIQKVYAMATSTSFVSTPEVSKDKTIRQHEEELRNAKQGDLIVFKDGPLQPKICMVMYLEGGDHISYNCSMASPKYDAMYIPNVAERVDRILKRNMDDLEWRTALDQFIQR